MTSAEAIGLVAAALELALVLVIVKNARALGPAFPAFAALVVFFALRAFDRTYEALFGTVPAAVASATDFVIVVVLALLLITVTRSVGALRRQHGMARARQDEYTRALHDYRVLARHRLANPITAIRGGIATLKDVDDLDSESARGLLDMVEAEAVRLEQTALDPTPVRAEEQALRPRPELHPEGRPWPRTRIYIAFGLVAAGSALIWLVDASGGRGPAALLGIVVVAAGIVVGADSLLRPRRR